MKDTTILIFALITSSLAPKVFAGSVPFEARLAYLPLLYFFFKNFMNSPHSGYTSRSLGTELALLCLPFISTCFYLAVSHNEPSWLLLLKAHVSVALFTIAGFTMARRIKVNDLLKAYILVVKAASLLTLVEQVTWIFFEKNLLQFLDHFFLGVQFRGDDGSLKRVHAWYREPAHYAQFLSLAVILVIITLGNKTRARELGIGSKFWKLIIIISSAMTFSLTGMVSFLVGVGILSSRIRRWPIAVIVAIGILMAAFTSKSIQDRLHALMDEQGYVQNLTTYSYVSNFFVSLTSIQAYPLGRGLGQHEVAHTEWLSEQTWLKDVTYRALNSQDGGSLVARLISELGIGAFVLFFIWLWKVTIALLWRQNVTTHDIRLAALFAILCYAIRQGSYTLFELWFFIAVYIAANMEAKNPPESLEPLTSVERNIAHAPT